jgi:DNA-directed RNA polymerase I, II, and III subunit RPABC1
MYKTICLEILEQRGYNILENDTEKIIAENPSKSKICVILSIIPKFNVERIEQCISFTHALNIKHAICIYSDNITSVAKTMIEKMVDMKFELFNIQELQYNITKHRLVPAHVKVSPEDSLIIKKEYGLKFGSLLKTDPITRFYGYERGDIIKISRKNGVVTYRIVR